MGGMMSNDARRQDEETRLSVCMQPGQPLGR